MVYEESAVSRSAEFFLDQATVVMTLVNTRFVYEIKELGEQEMVPSINEKASMSDL